MDIKKKLVMNFKTVLGKKVALSVDNPREDLNESEIKTAMENILAKNIFTSNGDDLVAFVDAKVVETGTTDYDLKL
ncbi:DUF2922 domain-containing protein [Romboutsia lituseburensis]|uniref:DUF2922 domain-containing protein n=1 Tax=Romboutsia lituseburensis DSM 797 TaxID=1121325 RepID=A0A1G9MN49_9FIRM|nr:DUF2922 domain-containing protein [Romboutsia lituseburensis]CEH34391.1 Protein of unknown function (DUF2922) [Romboutsia lituseburensis]SDL75544.1 Protein of unknown function [Romboutsia lituseburensis DSM 797]